MKNILIYAGILVLSFVSKTIGQETFEQQARAIATQIEKITKEEKAALKNQVELVNTDLEKGILNRTQADEKKLKLAEETAAKIENRVAEEQAKLTVLVKEKVEGRIVALDTNDNDKHSIKIKFNDKRDNPLRQQKRTTSQLVFATGVNNVVTNNAIANSEFRYMGSHFYEFGWTYNTRILKNDNLLHFKYGISAQYNNLRPTDNQYFVESGNQTNLQTSLTVLKDSRFRNVNVVVPMYLEFDTTRKKMNGDKTIFRIQDGFRFGIGGFVGANVKTKQILQYEDGFGNDVTSKTKGNYNVNDFVYGTGAYIGYKDTSLYVKYDLNPLFQNNAKDQNNISFGVRFDLN